ncbi:S8 family serine peptidase [Lacisediminimonas profundi]|uniref:S8 family serine peptidase n=1 Tax=Lacisediminimonas profundi TaxID=2603856 RepID=UPI00124B6B62|nr:S8 family serine peptidase [Lacisediminimonas profundi]
MKIRQALLALAAALCVALPVQAGLSIAPSPGNSASAPAILTPSSADPGLREELVSSLIVKPHRSRGARLDAALKSSDAGALQRATRVQLRVLRRMSGGSHVIRLPHPMPLSEARAIAARLMQEASIELAEPDRIMRPSTLTPNDPSYGAMQWNLMAPSGLNQGGVNLPRAWDATTGNSLVTVAVLDGGYLPHADLGSVLPGFDFLSTTSYMNGVTVGNGDGDGRDGDPRDPGNATAAGECGDGGPASRSSWHGTHVAGIIAAAMNNGIGGAGVAPNVRLLPVRVLGKCGGPTSDIVDGMRWAAGLYSIPGVGANPNVARVLNLSLGSAGSCSAAFQSAVNDVVNAGKLVVAAAGNDTVGVHQPANCNGAIAVAAHAVDGDLADYSNSGSQITISAPGGGCGRGAGSCLSTYSQNGVGIFSLSNRGTGAPQPSPDGDSYAVMIGSSMAAPHVSGVIALMLSLDPALTRSQVVSYLRASARPFPAGTTCAKPEYAGRCGAGMLDAAAALSVIAPSIAVKSNLVVVPPLTYVPLEATVSAAAGRSIVSTTWAPLPGNPGTVNIDNASTTIAGFNAPITGTYGFVLTALDSTGKTASATVTVRVNSAPVISLLGQQRGSAGSPLGFRLVAVDRDGDSPVFHAVDMPEGATLSADGRFEWDSTVAGTYSVTYYASDDYTTSSPATVMVNVAGGTGGGSMGTGALLALAVLAGGSRLRRWRAVRRA